MEEEKKKDENKDKSKKKKKKGFTLIELLAVIVILGLLMAIAIPSVTKYITQSRKKTVVSSIDGYIAAAVNSVNEQDFKFSTPNTIYAIPIECISTEKGGTNPFGEWLHANNNYWAYVLVQYDSENFNYNYGFTFKDSAGYGMYPTIQSEINPKSSDQIKTGLELTKPTSGKATDIAVEDNWNGFEVDSETNLVVLEAESYGTPGNGETTCTLCQKGSNYEQVEEEKTDTIDTPLYFGKPYEINDNGNKYSLVFYEDGSTDYYQNCELSPSEPKGTYEYNGNQIMGSYYDEDEDYYESWVEFIISADKKRIWYEGNEEEFFSLSTWCAVDKYENLTMLKRGSLLSLLPDVDRTKIKTITFQDSINIPDDAYKSWDVSRSQNGKVMAYITANVSDSSYYDLYIQGEGKIYANPNSSGLFKNLSYLDGINDIKLLDTSKVIDMSDMFSNTGNASDDFTLDLGDNFDTSNVTNMYGMFSNTGYKSKAFTLKLGDKFDTSNVTNMEDMFESTGYSSSTFLLDCSDWNVDKVIWYEHFNSRVETKVIKPTAWAN